MEVILLERIGRLGQMGDVVRVRNGYARNYLLPQGKALRATKQNMAECQTKRVQLEARNLELKSEAEQISGRLADQSFTADATSQDFTFTGTHPTGGNLRHPQLNAYVLRDLGPIPEPSAFALVGLAGLGLVMRRRRK